MDVEMVVNAGSRRLAQIHAEIEPLRLHRFGQNPDGKIHKSKELPALRRKKIGQTIQVAKWNDHEMAAGVRIAVHHDETVISLAENQAILVRGIPAENASSGFFPSYIGRAPRRKDRVHSETLSKTDDRLKVHSQTSEIASIITRPRPPARTG